MTETVVRIAARGDGVTSSGRFLPRVAPGDVVVGDVVVPGPHRAVPPCVHFGPCGGCQLQHLDGTAYSIFLTDRITRVLTEHGIAAPTILPPHLSPPRARRRTSLRAERRGRSTAIGFNEAASHQIIDLRECHVLRPELWALVDPLRALLTAMLPERGRATITMLTVDQGVDLHIAGPVRTELDALEMLTGFARRHELARLSIDEDGAARVCWAPAEPTIMLSGVRVGVPSGAFLQATSDGEAALVAAVRRATTSASRIVDLFAGLGTFALALDATALAVEGARDAAAALLATRRVPVMHRDLFRRPLSSAELKPFDAVVLDPPRAGAKEQIAEIARSDVQRVAYVSCNPATFARDARILTDEGFRLEWVKPVGQFNWSTHVELAAAFVL